MQSVYALLDPRTCDLRYIGMTQDVAARVQKHIREAPRTHSARGNWLRDLKSNGLQPISIVLDEYATRKQASDGERYWISRAASRGIALLNRTSGGQDGSLSDESKAKIGAKNRGRRPSPETRAKMSAAAKARVGRTVSAETRAKISAANKGKGHGPEWCAAHAERLRGRKASPETRAKMSASRMGNQNARRKKEFFSERKSAPTQLFNCLT